jgi:hypothetical protein
MSVQSQSAEYFLKRKSPLGMFAKELRQHLHQVLLVGASAHLRLVGGSLYACCLSLVVSLGLCHIGLGFNSFYMANIAKSIE